MKTKGDSLNPFIKLQAPILKQNTVWAHSDIFLYGHRTEKSDIFYKCILVHVK